jgi:hypothetical protein
VELLDSEDEEVLKQAQLVRMKQAFPHDSDESSDYEDMDDDDIILKHQLHAQGLAQVRYVNFTCHFYM